MNFKELSNKLFIPVLFIAFSFFSCKNIGKKSSTFELSGSLTQAGQGIHIYLDRLLPDSVEHIDSTTIDKDGKFSFHTSGIYKGFYTLRITDQDYAALILDSNEKVTITGNAQNLGYTYTVSGSPDSRLFWEFNMRSKENMMSRDSIQRVADQVMNSIGNNHKRMDSLNDALEGPYDTLVAKQNRYIKSFVKGNLNSFVCLAAIQQISPDRDIAYYIALDSTLTKKYPASVYVKFFHTKTMDMERLAIGSMAPDITLPDTTGKMVSLSSLKGRYVLIDFWASWCEPCKESLPGLVLLYEKYKDKNFTIYSVSLDKFKDKWTDAIKKFNLTWTQVSDLKYWSSNVVRVYNFSGIPYSVLISPEGRILDKKLSDEELGNELHQLLDKPKS